MTTESNLHQLMHQLGRHAREAGRLLSEAPRAQKDDALQYAATALRKNTGAILAANKEDMDAGRAKGLDAAMLDRLELNPKRIEAMAKGLEDIATLEDPVGKELTSWQRPNGLIIARVSVPLGVIGIIYESRPNVTADAGALCIKSGNAAILRGGSESAHSSQAIVACLHEGLKAAGLPEAAVQMVPTQDREAVGLMLTMTESIDVIVPRGGKGLCKRVMEESRIPTILHLDGNCHSYVHAKASPELARSVLLNAKMRRTGICGATESLVVDSALTNTLLPQLVDDLIQAGCEVRGDVPTQQVDKRVKPASDSDWGTEYLAPIISVKIVQGLDEAVDWVNTHSSHHTDAIITEDTEAAQTFLKRVDSAIVMHNTSTQFADGGEFGMGAEIGISTGRLHARGPVGVEQLTTYKYVVKGNGQVRPG